MTDQTRGMINKDSIAKMRDGVRLINCARAASSTRRICTMPSGRQGGGAALDVYEPGTAEGFTVVGLDAVVMTPHLAASTQEAQESVGVEVAEQIADVLSGGRSATRSTCRPIDAKVLAVLQPYLTFWRKDGTLLAQIAPQRIERLVIEFAARPASWRAGRLVAPC